MIEMASHSLPVFFSVPGPPPLLVWESIQILLLSLNQLREPSPLPPMPSPLPAE